MKFMCVLTIFHEKKRKEEEKHYFLTSAVIININYFISSSYFGYLPNCGGVCGVAILHFKILTTNVINYNDYVTDIHEVTVGFEDIIFAKSLKQT